MRKQFLVLLVVSVLMIGVVGSMEGSAPPTGAVVQANLLNDAQETEGDDDLFDVEIAVINNQQNRTVPDVVSAFDGLTTHGEWLAFYRGGAQWTEKICVPQDYLDYVGVGLNWVVDRIEDAVEALGFEFAGVNYHIPMDWFKPLVGPLVQEVLMPPSCPYPINQIGVYESTTGQHFQGIARSPQAGRTPILYVTRSGDPHSDKNTTDGAIWVVRMDSRTRSGERLRSNRLQYTKETRITRPPANDTVIKQVMLNHGPLDYHHPGGIQMVGDILAVSLAYPEIKTYCDEAGEPEGCMYKGKIAFFNAADAENPRYISERDVLLTDDAWGVGIEKHPDLNFLMVVNISGKKLQFYQSNGPRFEAKGFKFCPIGDPIPWLENQTLDPEPQSVNIIREEGSDDLYLIGARNTDAMSPILSGDNEIYLWKINLKDNVESMDDYGDCKDVDNFESTPIELVGSAEGLQGNNPSSHHLFSQGEISFSEWWKWALERQESNFAASSGAYVSPSGELLYYGTTHWNEGPGQTARVAELRHEKLSHTGSCGIISRPDHLGTSHTIPEGSRLEIYGGVTYVQPWVQMYVDNSYRKASLMMDWEDQGLDDYSLYRMLDGWSDIDYTFPIINETVDVVTDDCSENGFHDCMSSFRFCGPPGSKLEIMGDYAGDGGYQDPSSSTWDDARDGPDGYLVCNGDGTVMETADVSNLPSGCSHHGRGDAGGFGDEADAALITWTPPTIEYEWTLEGAGDIELSDEGRLATYSAGVGSSTNIVKLKVLDKVYTTEIVVENVPPFIDIPRIPTMEEGQLIELEFDWWDPGRSQLDITIDWDDGIVDPTFISEGESNGDGYYQGEVLAQHVYADDGRYILNFCAFDGEAEYCRIPYIPVVNVPPEIFVGQDQMLFEGDLLAPVKFSDKGTLDTHTATIDWGDEQGFQPAPVIEEPSGPPGSVDGMQGLIAPDLHTLAPGVYDVTVCVRDDDMDDDPENPEPDVCDSLSVTVVHGFMRYCAYANEKEIQIQEDAMLACSIGGMDKIELKKNSTVVEDVVSEDDVKLAEGSEVGGTVYAAGKVELKKDAEAGAVVENADILDVTQVELEVSSGHRNRRAKKGRPLILYPGAYSKLEVKEGATLQLSDGVYTFRSIKVEKNATLVFDIAEGESTIINVMKNVDIQDGVTMIAGSRGAAGILFKIAGNNLEVGKETALLGTFIAPEAYIHLHEDAHLTGHLYGEKLQIKKSATVSYMPALDPFMEEFLP